MLAFFLPCVGRPYHPVRPKCRTQRSSHFPCPPFCLVPRPPQQQVESQMLAARSLKHLKDGHASFPSSSTPAYASSSFPSRGPPASEGRLYGPMHGSMNPHLSSGYGGNFQSHLLPPGYQNYSSYGNIREMHRLAPAFPPYHPGPGAFHMQHVYPNNAGLTDVPLPLPAPSSYPPFPSPSSVAALDGPGSMVRD